MDPRRQALQEILGFLRQEGWAPAQPEIERAESTFISRESTSSSAILKIVCAFSILANVFLIAGQHDAGERATGTHATLVLSSLKESLKEVTIIRGVSFFLTVDGKEVWRRSSKHAASLEFKETVPIDFVARCVIQLWRDHAGTSEEGRRPEFIDQSFVLADQAGDTPLEIDLKADDGSHYQLTTRVTRSRPSSSR